MVTIRHSNNANIVLVLRFTVRKIYDVKTVKRAQITYQGHNVVSLVKLTNITDTTRKDKSVKIAILDLQASIITALKSKNVDSAHRTRFT